MRIPKYRHFRARNIAFVEWQGERIYFSGKPYDSPQSRDEYWKFIRDNVVEHTEDEPTPIVRPNALTLAKFTDLFLEHAERSYGKDKDSEFRQYRKVLTFALKTVGGIRARDFGPLALAQVQRALAKSKTSSPNHKTRKTISRRHVNQQIGRLRRAFKWGVSQEIITAEHLMALQTVAGLREGASKARETNPRGPVSWEIVESCIPHLTPTLEAMVRLQWLTGARSQNVCNLRPTEIDLESYDGVWAWRPESHKTKSRGHDLIIFLGPQSKEVISPFLDRDPVDYCFSPKESKSYRRKASIREETFGNLRDRYSPTTYLKAVLRAVGKQVEPPLRAPFKRSVFEKHGIEYWTPHQLRHARAQQLRNEHGLEAAQAILGHASLSATQIYARKRQDLAITIARVAS